MITIDIKYQVDVTPYFADGIDEVIFTTKSVTFGETISINVYIPIEISLSSAKEALKTFEEGANAEGSEI